MRTIKQFSLAIFLFSSYVLLAQFPESFEDLEKEIHALMKICGKPPRCAVSEVYSPGRFTDECNSLGLEPGTAFDLRTGWDFTRKAHREAADRLLDIKQPWLLIGSPICGPFSQLQALRPDTPESLEKYIHS